MVSRWWWIIDHGGVYGSLWIWIYHSDLYRKHMLWMEWCILYHCYRPWAIGNIDTYIYIYILHHLRDQSNRFLDQSASAEIGAIQSNMGTMEEELPPQVGHGILRFLEVRGMLQVWWGVCMSFGCQNAHREVGFVTLGITVNRKKVKNL